MVWASALLMAAAALGQGAEPQPCLGIEGVSVDGLTVDAANPYLPGSENLPEGAPNVSKSFCRVEARIDGTIGIELWLPDGDNWNRKLLTGGVGGQGGYYNYRVLGRAVDNAYLGATTDTGHKRENVGWMLNDAVAVENFVELAHHRLAEVAKDVADQFYGAQVLRSLFLGCSGAGRQGLIEAQRFPTDYDGIIVGAPGPDTAGMSARRMWEMILHRDFGDEMTQDQWDLIARRAIAHCDFDDGLRDNVVADPQTCNFRIESLACEEGQSIDCLNPFQVNAARIVYGPMEDENGQRIDRGLLPTMRVARRPLPLPGEPGANVIALAVFGDVVHADRNWNGMTFNMAQDLPQVDKITRLSPRDPVLDSFVAHGGKIIIYHGLNDSIVDPRSSIDYFEAIKSHTDTGDQDADFSRLYLVPGMEHCSGGNGVDQFGGDAGDPPLTDRHHNMLAAMETWLDTGEAPDTLLATRQVDGEIAMERPICAYPKELSYDGSGDPDNAASFTCVAPAKPGV